MAAEAVLTPPKQTGSLILKLVPGPKMGQDALQESVPPKTIHQLVLEHFFTFLPEKNQSQNHKTGKEDTIIVVKDVTSTLQNRAHPASWVTIFPKDRRIHKREMVPQTFPSELQEPVVFEDLNVYHSQEEYVGLDLAQRSPFSRNHGEEDVGDMVLEVDCNENKEDDQQPENPEDIEEHHEVSSGYCERDSSQIFKQAKGCEKHPDSHEGKRLNTSIPQEKRLRSLLITVENDAPLEDLSKYVDMSILALSQNRRTRRFYTCPQCGKHFTESSYLISHQRTHTGEKPYDCIHCGKSFNHKTNLNKHERIHTGEKPYTCSQCGKNFRQNSHRSRHEVIHVKEKLLKCQECGKSFLGDEEFLLHQETHEEERPYRCSRCGRRFSRQSNCTRHEKAHFIPKPQKQVLSS